MIVKCLQLMLHWQFLLTSLKFLTFHLFMTVIFSCKFFFLPNVPLTVQDGSCLQWWKMVFGTNKQMRSKSSSRTESLYAVSMSLPETLLAKAKIPNSISGSLFGCWLAPMWEGWLRTMFEVSGGTKPKWPFLQLDCFQSALPLVSSPQRKAVQLEGSQCNDAEWENPGLDCAFKIWQRAFYQLCLWSRVQRGKAVQLTVRKIALHVP